MGSVLSRLTRLCSLIMGVGLVAGCFGTGQKEPLAPPTSAVTVNHFAGTPISGPVPEIAQTQPASTEPATQASSQPATQSSTEPATEPANQPATQAATQSSTQPAIPTVLIPNAQEVTVKYYALEKMPENALEPLGAYAQLITASRGGMPVLPTTRLTLRGRFARLSAPQQIWDKLSQKAYLRQAQIGSGTGLLRPGQTVTFAIDDPQSILDTLAGESVHRRISVQVYRGEGKSEKNMTLGVILEDIAPPEDADDAQEKNADNDAPAAAVKSRPQQANKHGMIWPLRDVQPPTTRPASSHTQRELALIDVAAKKETQAFAVLLPFQFENSAINAVVAVVEIHAAGEIPVSLVSQANQDVNDAAQAMKLTQAPVDQAEHTNIRQAFAAMQNSATRRAALVYAAGQVDAALCTDFALVANDANLDALTKSIVSQVSLQPVPKDLGWQLDRVTFQFLSEMARKRRMQIELRAVLTTFAGEAGQHAPSLEELSRNMISRDDLNSRMVAENMIYLEDQTPSTRIRAYDWLKARKQAPDGYDPLGRRKDREAALEKASQQSGSTTGGQP